MICIPNFVQRLKFKPCPICPPPPQWTAFQINRCSQTGDITFLISLVCILHTFTLISSNSFHLHTFPLFPSSLFFPYSTHSTLFPLFPFLSANFMLFYVSHSPFLVLYFFTVTAESIVRVDKQLTWFSFLELLRFFTIKGTAQIL